MRYISFALLTMAVGTMACGNSTSDTADAGVANKAQTTLAMGADDTSADADADATAVAAAEQPNQAKPQPPKAGQYRLLGILDPGFNLVAFALKVPRGWLVKQSFWREWDGQVPKNKVYVAFRSPDGAQQVEYLPLNDYQYADGPMSENLRMQKRLMNIDPRMAPNDLAPMPAAVYVKQVLLPQLAKLGLQVQNVGNERQTPPQSKPAQMGSRTESSASIDGVLPNGHKVRVEARVGVNQMTNNGETYYQWSVVPSITRTTGDNLAATYEKTKTAQESIVYNPTWAKQNAEVVNKGYRANSEASRLQHEATMANMQAQADARTQAHNQQMAAIAASGAANTARHNERLAASDQQLASYYALDASRDRQHEAYVDNAINNEAKMVNPSTGQQVKLDNRYEHAYTDSKGSYYQSNTPLQASDVKWQELAKAPLSDY